MTLFKQKWLSSLLAAIICATVILPAGPANKAAAATCDGVTPGSTQSCPIMIGSAAELDAMHGNLSAHYALEADIDLQDYLDHTYNNGDGWIPVGNTGSGGADAFSGTLDGNGHTISNLRIRTNQAAVGLFGYLFEASVRNIGLLNVDIEGSGSVESRVGGLAGFVTNSAIENSYVTGTVTGTYDTGGLVGYAIGGAGAASTIFHSYAAAVVSSPYQFGGLVGYSQGLVVVNSSYYNSDLTHISYLGIPLSEADMKSAASFGSWTFDPQSSWGILEGISYPMHRTTLNQILLEELSVNDGAVAFAPAFSADTLTYSSRVSGETDSVTVSVYTSSSHITTSINGMVTDSRVIPLLPINNTVNIHVSTDVSVPGVAANPLQLDYTLDIIRENGATYPHRITTASRLADIGNAHYTLDASYELMNDLDLSEFLWEPIGTNSQPFTGTFEGNGHVIRNLTVSGAADDSGLFGESSGTIRNIGLEGAAVSGGARVGGLVGSNSGTVSNAYVKGNVSGDEQVGGLIGLNSGAATVEFTYAAALVSGSGSIGGLIGEDAGGAVTASYWDNELGPLAVSGGGEGKSTADMYLSDTYSGWFVSGTWSILNGSTYPMFTDHFEAVKLQTLSVTAADGAFSWTPAAFLANQGRYSLLADRYVQSADIDATPAHAATAVTVGAAASAPAQVDLTAGSNEIVITTSHPGGAPQGEYRLMIEVPAPEITALDIPAAGYYRAGDALTFTVSYEGNVEVTGVPTIPVVIGDGADATTVYAAYAGHAPGELNKLIFTYAVQAGLMHTTDIAIGSHIQLDGGAQIHAASTTVPVPLALPAATTTGITVDSVVPDITLTQQPADTVVTNPPVTVTAAIDGTGSAVNAAKWAAGSRDEAYFASGGQALTVDSFEATANGTYTVYAVDEAGNSSVAMIDIANIASGLPQISLSHSPTRSARSVTVTVVADVQGAANALAALSWQPGSHTEADFVGGTVGTDIMTDGQFIVNANGVYTVYARDAAGNEAVAEITISNIGRTSTDSDDPGVIAPGGEPEQPTPSTGPAVQMNADGGVSIVFDSAHIANITLEDGAIAEQAVLTEELFERLLELLGEAQKPVVTVVIDDSGQAVRVQLPAASLSEVKDAYPDAVFETAPNDSRYLLPVNALNLGQHMSHIYITVSKAAGQTKAQLEQAAAAAGLHPASVAVAFKVTASDGRQTLDIGDSGNAAHIVRAITLDESAAGDRFTAVLYNPATQTLSFAPAVVSARADGRREMSILSPYNGIYAVMNTGNRSFSDMRGHWAQAHVELLASKLIVSGISATQFAPDATITRAEFTALLVRALGLSGGQTAADTAFADVSGEDWFAAAVAAAVKAGLVSGVSDHAFAPGRTITREQMAVMLSNALTLLGYPAITAEQAAAALDTFGDSADISPWARPAVAQASAAGIILGTEDGAVAPSEPATRAQAAVMLRRFLQHVRFID